MSVMSMRMITNIRIIGSGEKTVVFSHGYGGSQAVWEKVMPYLSERYQLLLFDWDFSAGSGGGGGGSVDSSKYSFAAFADDLISLIDEMSLSSTIFVGHSMAGMIGCIASIKRPDLFSHLLLIGASPRYLNTVDYEGGFEREDVDNLFSHIQSDFHAWADSFVAVAVAVNDPNSIEIVGKSFHSMKPEIALVVARTIFLSDNRDILDKVEVACTVIQVANDFAVPLSVGHYMQSKMKGKATLEIIETDGHFPQLTAHRSLLGILDRVLKI